MRLASASAGAYAQPLNMANPSAPAPGKRDTLFLQVIAGVVVGIVLGLVWPHCGATLKPLADGFIALVRMLVTPIIFLTVVVGVGGMSDLKKVGRVGGLWAILYFEIVTTFALALGLLVANVWRPGAGMNISPASLDSGAIAVYAKAAPSPARGRLRRRDDPAPDPRRVSRRPSSTTISCRCSSSPSSSALPWAAWASRSGR